MEIRTQGFSLLELMAAMAIVALALVITAPPLANMLDKVAFRKEVNGVMAQVRGWKLLAVSKGEAVTITLEEDVLVVHLAGEEMRRTDLKHGVTLSMEPDHILFSPEGWATPATLEISTEERRQRVRIDPLTGQPRRL
ncbi:MAG: prepilin-type N-terminal cleavage/methylation domain-containing protein [Desulfurivibrionaceae bacterium]|nr:prepilin-type N-terminal cleavage/methylation domain-containing protein [Desulfurivibrionaceae bacterium]